MSKPNSQTVSLFTGRRVSQIAFPVPHLLGAVNKSRGLRVADKIDSAEKLHFVYGNDDDDDDTYLKLTGPRRRLTIARNNLLRTISKYDIAMVL